MSKAAAFVVEDEEQDEYEDIDRDRPTLDPVERPSDERGDRPMRVPTPTRWGPRRGRTR